MAVLKWFPNRRSRAKVVTAFGVVSLAVSLAACDRGKDAAKAKQAAAAPPPPAVVHCPESWLAFAPCPSFPASLAAVIVVQTVSRETGSDLEIASNVRLPLAATTASTPLGTRFSLLC